MWLLDVATHKLHEFQGAKIPEYVVLSHTWGDEEVTFRDLDEHPHEARRKAGYSKIAHTCSRARENGYRWAWVDTCCIDKRSSAELSEAINSMFQWYERAKVCYVHLADVSTAGCDVSRGYANDEFARSRWFRRGWTLQELIAPDRAVFFSASWTVLGRKSPLKSDADFVGKLSSVTGIGVDVLTRGILAEYSVAQRMSWASRRSTTREEDLAYCLMGLFNVHMPILYGEGGLKAFRRLQWEIILTTPDETIFGWRKQQFWESSGLLASSPSDFGDSSDVVYRGLHPDAFRSHSMTNVGLYIEADLIDPEPAEATVEISGKKFEVMIMSIGAGLRGAPGEKVFDIGLYVARVYEHGMANRRVYRRVHCDRLCIEVSGSLRPPRERSVPIHVLEDGQYEWLSWR